MSNGRRFDKTMIRNEAEAIMQIKGANERELARLGRAKAEGRKYESDYAHALKSEMDRQRLGIKP
jgi:hypothetical protein